MTGHTGPVWNVAFSPNGERLASASWDGTVKIWDVTTGQETLTFKGHGNWVWGVAFSLDGQRLASGGMDGTVKLWDASPLTVELLLDREAGGVVEYLIAKRLPKNEIGSRIRANRTISDPVRERALALVDPYWNGRIRQDASRLVKSLFAKLLLQSSVIEAIRQDTTLDEELRKEALHHASRTEENLRRLKEASSKVLRRPDADEPDYSSALQYAQAASRLRPGEGPILTLLGVAQYRVGDYQAALETLTRSENINSTGPDGTRPADLAFLAMTQYQLGNRALARATLDRLRETVKNPRWANNANPQAFVQEAEILIRGEDN